MSEISEDTKKTIVLHGKSGSGKTAIMAKIKEELVKNKQAIVIIRFFGTSPNSSTIHSILKVIF